MSREQDYDFIFVTHLPAFYKVNLYRELSKRFRIFVVFVGQASGERSADFTPGNIAFEHSFLSTGRYEERCRLLTVARLARILLTKRSRRICVNGWELIEFWLAIFLSRRGQLALSLESTVYESSTTGTRGLVKRLFLKRISTVFASSVSARDLLRRLDYNGRVLLTHGVGLIHKPEVRPEPLPVYQKRFIFIGRLVPVKNLHEIVRIFHQLPDYHLTIAGDGPLERELRALASSNISFVGHIANSDLPGFICKYNFLILMSVSETWGLVVEEAMHCGIPVIVSRNCGVSEMVDSGKTGFVIEPGESSLRSLLPSITPEIHERITARLRAVPTHEKDEKQLKAYADSLNGP